MPSDVSRAPQDFSAQQFLLGNSFRFSLMDPDALADTYRTVWGRTSGGQFVGGEGTLLLGCSVVTGLVGADMQRGRMLAGMAGFRTLGEGSLDLRFPHPGTTDVDASRPARIRTCALRRATGPRSAELSGTGRATARKFGTRMGGLTPEVALTPIDGDVRAVRIGGRLHPNRSRTALGAEGAHQGRAGGSWKESLHLNVYVH